MTRTATAFPKLPNEAEPSHTWENLSEEQHFLEGKKKEKAIFITFQYYKYRRYLGLRIESNIFLQCFSSSVRLLVREEFSSIVSKQRLPYKPVFEQEN